MVSGTLYNRISIWVKIKLITPVYFTKHTNITSIFQRQSKQISIKYFSNCNGLVEETLWSN